MLTSRSKLRRPAGEESEESVRGSGDGRRRTSWMAAVCACLVVVFGACSASVSTSPSDGGGPDLAELEAKLVDLQKEKAPDLDVEGAECPEDVDLDKGSRFECTVTIEGVEAPYSITLEEDDPEGDSGSFHIEPALAIIDVSIVVDFLKGRAEGADVACGQEAVIVGDVGDTFDCTIDSGGQHQTVEMIIKDLDGTVAINK
jgi:Domain of unknown function (DUF4333)